jgi:formylmethanofuran dehydrogenase subunit E
VVSSSLSGNGRGRERDWEAEEEEEEAHQMFLRMAAKGVTPIPAPINTATVVKCDKCKERRQSEEQTYLPP